jgi:ribose/xylose/arabinose/galactoside ABC-type transport system permease subunit
MSQTLSYAIPETKKLLSFGSIWQKLGPFIGLIFVFGLFAALRPRTFATTENIQLMLVQTAVVGAGALGMTIIIISAGIDLSVGSVVALSSVTLALLLNAGVPQILAVAGGVGVGVLSGFVTGNLIIGQIGRVLSVVTSVGIGAWLVDAGQATWLVGVASLIVFVGGLIVNELFLKEREFNSHLGLIPFIATLGMMGALRGVAHWLGDNSTVVVRGPMWCKQLLAMPHDSTSWQIFPPGVWLVGLLAILVALSLRYVRFGRHVYAIGSNEKTARLCGINVERTKLLIYMIGVGFAGLGGVLQFAFVKEGDSTTAPGMELSIIAAVVIGGASPTGGEGSVLGSMVGALIMTVVANGCTKMGLDTYWQEMITGGIIIIACQIDRLRHRKAG